jgi:hypothetical protein
MPSMFKEVAKQMLKLAPNLQKLDTVDKMVSFIFQNEQHPLGQKLAFIYRNATVAMVTSLWDGIICQLMLELSQPVPSKSAVETLVKKLPVDDASADSIRSSAAAMLTTLRQNKLNDIDIQLSSVKGKRAARRVQEEKLMAERRQYESINIEALTDIVMKTATNIWASDDSASGLSSLIEMAQQVINGETVVSAPSKVSKTTKTSTTKTSKPVTAPVAVVTNSFALLESPFAMDPIRESEALLLGQMKKPEHSPLQRAGRIVSTTDKQLYIMEQRVRLEERDIGYRAIVIGPFATKEAARKVLGVVKKVAQSAACERDYQKSDAHMKVYEVHLMLTRPDGKKSSDVCAALEKNVENSMTKLIGDIAAAAGFKPSTINSTFPLPADPVDIEDNASVESDDSDDSSVCSSDSDDSDDSSVSSSDSDDSDNSSVSSSDSEDEFVIPGCGLKQSYVKNTASMGFDMSEALSVAPKPGARNNKSFRHEGVSGKRMDRGMQNKGGKGPKNYRDD